MRWNCYLRFAFIIHEYSLLLQSYYTGFGSWACHIGNLSINKLKKLRLLQRSSTEMGAFDDRIQTFSWWYRRCSPLSSEYIPPRSETNQGLAARFGSLVTIMVTSSYPVVRSTRTPELSTWFSRLASAIFIHHIHQSSYQWLTIVIESGYILHIRQDQPSRSVPRWQRAKLPTSAMRSGKSQGCASMLWKKDLWQIGGRVNAVVVINWRWLKAGVQADFEGFWIDLLPSAFDTYQICRAPMTKNEITRRSCGMKWVITLSFSCFLVLTIQ